MNWHWAQEAKGLHALVFSQSRLSIFLQAFLPARAFALWQKDFFTATTSFAWQFSKRGCAINNSITQLNMKAVNFILPKMSILADNSLPFILFKQSIPENAVGFTVSMEQLMENETSRISYCSFRKQNSYLVLLQNCNRVAL